MIPELVDALTNNGKKMLSGVHTAVPGKIVSFDAQKGLAVVLPEMALKKKDGSKLSYPQITGVPVVFPQSAGQQAAVVFPVKEGDGCLLVFAEKSIEPWLNGGESDTELDFDLSNAIAIPGLFNLSSEYIKEACQKDAVIIARQNRKITITSEKIIIDGDVQVNGKMTLTGDVIAAGISLDHHTHSGVEPGSGSTGQPKQ